MASSSSSNRHEGKIIKRANPGTIQDKFMVGYQGWFTCGGDGEPVGPGHHGWLHWLSAPIADGGHPNVDVWPDVSAYSPSELFPVPGLKTKTGDPVFLFSSRNPKTVQRHFHWMAEHGVDGAFLQRFVGQCDVEAGNEGIRRIRDEVGDRVQEAAEREGRVFAIMYDVVGVPPERLLKVLQQDWMHLIRNKGILDSPNYLKERGKPVVALWGLGFDNAKHTPELVRSIARFFRNTTPGGVYLMAGTPSQWRTAEGDADPNPEFLNAWLEEFDAISPWTVGRYSNDQEADNFLETRMKADVELINHRNEQGTGKKVDYIPVVLPGGSGFNTSEGRWGFNNVKRNGGRFLWKQIVNAKRLGVRTMYGAMWDEYDEGTAFMPVVERKNQLPDSDTFKFMALDEDGYDVTADWYMRICGFAAEGLRGERRIFDTFPVKELQDYWSSRPKYEEVSQKQAEFVSGAGGSGEGDGQTYQEWLASQKDDKDELPPPPYTLISDEPEPSSSNSGPSRAPAQAHTSAAVHAPAPTPIPAGVSHLGPATALSSASPAAASAPAPVTDNASSLTSAPQQGSRPVSTLYNNAPNASQAPPVSGYGNEARNSNVPVGAYSPQPHLAGSGPAGSGPAAHPPQQSYYTGGGPPPATNTDEARQSTTATGYGASSYNPNVSPNLAPNGSPQPQQLYNASGPQVGSQPANNQTGYGSGGYGSGPPPNVSANNVPPQQPYHGVPPQGAQNTNAPSGSATSYQGGPPPGAPGATLSQQAYNAPEYGRQATGAPIGGPQQGNNQAGYPPNGSQTGLPPPAVPGGHSPQQPYLGTANQGLHNNISTSTPGGSASSYQGGPPGPPGPPRPQQPYNSSDPVSSLTHDFGRQNISGAPVGTAPGASARPGAASPSPPVHPAHPSANQPGAYAAQSSAYPGSSHRPTSRPNSRPQSMSYAPPNPGAPSHNVGSGAAPQWPPKEWGVNQPQRPNTTSSPPPPIPHSTHPQGPPTNAGSAMPPRPGTGSASSYVGGSGASVRPAASLSHRPQSRPPPPHGPAPSGNYPGSYRPGSAAGNFPPTQSYNTPPQPYGGGGDSSFPQVHPSAAPYNVSNSSAVSFPGGPSSPYPPSMSSYQAPGVSSFPGSSEGPSYGSSRPNFAWPGGPSGSPPLSPSSGTGFPGADVYNPSQAYSPGASSTSFPSSSPYAPGGALSGPNVGGHGYSQMPGGPSYPGGGMPSADQSAYQPSYGPPGDPYGSSSTYPNSGGSSFPAPSPWAGGSGPGGMMPPPLPHRPSSSSATASQGKPSSTSTSFPMASGALDFARNTVDKVAGKKTREQLENQVGNLAQTGTKLFNKLTR